MSNAGSSDNDEPVTEQSPYPMEFVLPEYPAFKVIVQPDPSDPRVDPPLIGVIHCYDRTHVVCTELGDLAFDTQWGDVCAPKQSKLACSMRYTHQPGDASWVCVVRHVARNDPALAILRMSTLLSAFATGKVTRR